MLRALSDPTRLRLLRLLSVDPFDEGAHATLVAMSVEVRPIEPSEFEAIIVLDGRAFGLTYTPEDYDFVRAILELDRTFVAVDRAEVVGSTSAFSFAMVPQVVSHT